MPIKQPSIPVTVQKIAREVSQCLRLDRFEIESLGAKLAVLTKSAQHADYRRRTERGQRHFAAQNFAAHIKLGKSWLITAGGVREHGVWEF
jgi:hypothetical protein